MKVTLFVKSHSIPYSCFASILFIIIISTSQFHKSEAAGISFDLIHRDSLRPTPGSSLVQVENTLKRSFHRMETLTKVYNRKSASADIVLDRGEYLMRFSLGTPPVQTLAIADTGSDLTWIQCKPCTSCFTQKEPVFDPKRSSSYKSVPCASTQCSSIPRTSCNGSNKTCSYTMSYGDGSFSKGDVATETVTLGSTNTKRNVSIPNVIMGCGHLDHGTFGEGTSGIVGLGGGRASLISQMGSLIRGKFSYCLVAPSLSGPASKPSTMYFGDSAVVSGDNVVSTQIVSKTPNTFYFLTLEGLSVGNRRLDLVDFTTSSSTSHPKAAVEEGNIIIDSGTTLTFLPLSIYVRVVEEVRKQINGEETTDPLGLLKLCYRATDDITEKLPEMTAHFKGADVRLKPVNTFVQTSQLSLCLAFAPASRLAIYGNLAQMNYLVGYDLEKKTVSFMPTDCSKGGRLE